MKTFAALRPPFPLFPLFAFANALLLSLSAHAISEKDYVANYAATVTPFIDAHWEQGRIERAPAVPRGHAIQLAYHRSVVAQEKGVIVFAPGMGEGAFRYPELAYDFAQAGYSFYVLDPRGQGASQRLLPNSRAEYVESYDDYVADLHGFADFVRAQGHSRLLLLTNSMGGAVGALAMRAYPSDFVAAALAVPMFGINLQGLTEDFALQYAQSQVQRGHGADYAPGMGEPNFDWRPDPRSTLGRDLRAGVVAEYLAAHRDEATGGVSFRWLQESILATRRLQRPASPANPVLILQAGQDTTVLAKPQSDFCAAATHCQLQTFVASSHGLLTENDASRDAALRAILDFFSKN